MDPLDAFIIMGVAALIHTSFQLGVSVLTLLSSHTIGKHRSHARLIRLTGSYLLGTATMTVLLLSSLCLLLLNIFSDASIPLLVWAVVCGLLIGSGIAVWAFYYRKGKGTTLWLPRGIAHFLTERTKSTRLSVEAFSLGLSGVIAELLFIAGPLLVTGMVLIQLDPFFQLVGIAFYTFISLISLLIVAGLVGSGHKISRIQRWREDNKRFLQFVGGGGLIVLGVYVYVNTVLISLSLAGVQ